MRNIISICILVTSAITLFAQPKHVIMHHHFYNRFEQAFEKMVSPIHTALKPLRFDQISKAIAVDSLIATQWDTSRKYNQSLIQTQKLAINPILNAFFMSGGYFETKNGAAIDFTPLNNWHFHADIAGGYSLFPDDVHQKIKSQNIVPGQGFAFFAPDSTVSYTELNAYTSINAGKWFNIEAGFGRNFIGDGYRSLILSDAAYSYPYLKINTNVWKLQYTNLFAQYRDIRRSNGNPADFDFKFSASHVLSIQLTKRLQIGVFETIHFRPRDTTSAVAFDVNYLNPVIFYRPIEYSLGSQDNALLGMFGKLKINNKIQLYGQLVLDEFLLKNIRAEIKHAIRPSPTDSAWGWWGNKFAWQAGIKIFHLFTIPNLNFQAEANFIRPYMYSHGSAYSNAGHYNSSTGHPAGANLFETITLLRYFHKKWQFRAQYNYSYYGDDYGGINFGRNIYQSYRFFYQEFQNFVGQGLTNTLHIAQLSAGYLIFPQTNTTFELQFYNYNLSNQFISKNVQYLGLGIKTNLYNYYTDY
jgi:hypothetical protein